MKIMTSQNTNRNELYSNENELYSYFNEFRLQKKFYDVCIKVGERTFPCHRVILASALKCFREKFSGVSNEAERKEIELKNLDADEFELVLSHIYGASVSFSENNAFRLLQISQYLGLRSLENLCVNHLIECADEVSSKIAIDVFLFASRIKNVLLVEKFTKNVAENFQIALKYAKFIHISGTDLLKILDHPNLNKEPSATMDFLIKWSKVQSNEDRKLMPDLLAALDLQNVPKEYLVKGFATLMNNPISANSSEDGGNELSNNIQSSDRIINVNDGSIVEENIFGGIEIDGEKEFSKQDEIKLPFVLYVRTRNEYRRRNEPSNFYKLCRLEKICTNEVTMMDPSDYKLFQPLGNDFILACKSFFVNNVHYCMVLEKDDPRSYSRFTCSPYTCHKWKLNQRLNLYYTNINIHERRRLPRTPSMAVRNNSIIYYDNENLVILHCERNEWRMLPTENLFKTEHPNLVSHDQSLYLIGGKLIAPDKSHERCFQQLDVRQFKWIQMPNKMKYFRSHSASCVHNDILYVSGGDNIVHLKGSVECYDFKAGKWYEFEKPMPKPKMDHTFFAYNDQLWFFGGDTYESGNIVGDLTWYSYNLKERTWSDVFSLSIPKADRIMDVIVDINHL